LLRGFRGTENNYVGEKNNNYLLRKTKLNPINAEFLGAPKS